MLNITLFKSSLRTSIIGHPSGHENEVWESISSTNERALTLAQEGAPQGLVVAARHQSAGRGRQGRSWHSPPDTGLYASILLRPHLPANRLPLLSFAAGVAAAEAILLVAGLEIQLKWVNDLILAGKKVGGILAESTYSQDKQPQRAVIIGTGINLTNPGNALPAELSDKIAFINDWISEPVNINALLAAYCNAFEFWYAKVEADQTALLLNTWRKLSITLGKQVVIHDPHSIHPITGLALDIDESGALLVQATNKTISKIHAGDVSVRLQDGSYC